MMRIFLALFALLHLCATAVVTVPGSLPEGSRCVTTTLTGANELCMEGLECVIWSHGMPDNLIENSGTCVKINRNTLNDCSISYCSRAAYAAVCADSRAPFKVTTCGAFAERVDGGRAAACSECGSTTCSSPNFFASDGSSYCRACQLEYMSCRSGFRVFGPVPRAVAPASAPCSTSDRSVARCKPGSVCLVSDFGFPGQGRASSGKCVPDGPFATCSIAFCTDSGQYAYCRTPLERVATRCGVWARRKDFGYKPDCRILCPRGFCANPRPLDATKKAWCTPCHLRVASCESNFAIFGRIAPPVSAAGAVCSSTNPRSGPRLCQQGHVCELRSFGYPLGGFANSGICKPGPRWAPPCNTSTCPVGETDKRCRTVDTFDFTTCRYWRQRSDGGL